MAKKLLRRAAFEIVVIQMMVDTSFSDITQDVSVGYNRTDAANGLPQKIHVLQRTKVLTGFINAQNSALRVISPLEIQATFANPLLREHNSKSFSFFKKFEASDVSGTTYDGLFSAVKAMTKATPPVFDSSTAEIVVEEEEEEDFVTEEEML
jgi:hypothetical protein